MATSWYRGGQGASPETRAPSSVWPLGPVSNAKCSLPVRCGTQVAWQFLGPTGHFLWQCPQIRQLCWRPLHTPVSLLPNLDPVPASTRQGGALACWPQSPYTFTTHPLAMRQSLKGHQHHPLSPHSKPFLALPNRAKPGTYMVHMTGPQIGHSTGMFREAFLQEALLALSWGRCHSLIGSIRDALSIQATELDEMHLPYHL